MQATTEKVDLIGMVEARRRLGVSEHVMKHLAALDVFTDVRLTPGGHRRFCVDELDRWLELTNQGLPIQRVHAGVVQLRRERKRTKK